MAQLLAGAKALVTGGGRGMGTVTARRLAEEGALVAVTYRGSREGAETTVRAIRETGGQAWVFQADLTSENDAVRLVEQAKDALNGLDVLVNNAAGFGSPKLLAESSWDDLNDEWQAVVRPVAVLTRAVLPGFLAQKKGKIVNLAATLIQRPAPTFGAHTMAKSAVLAYTRTLAREVGPYGITVNAVSPGMTRTEWTENLPDEEKAAVAARTPLRRLATPDDVADAVLFFCSPLADFVTGANLAPDGGLAVL